MRRLIVLLSLLTLLISAAAASAQVVHIVQPGETLFRIAVRYNTNIYAIAQANHLYNLNRIYAGQRLIIPSGHHQPTYPTPTPVPPQPTVYVVRYGDRLADIAQLYNTTVQAIAQANGILNPNYIFPGQRLIIPGATPQPPVVTTYYVQHGDNLTSIAYRFGTTPQALANYNAIPFPYHIYPGQALLIPH